MGSKTLLLSVVCLLAFIAVSSAQLKKREIKTTPPKDVEINQNYLTVSPINVAGFAGETITLVCEVDSPPPNSRVHWWEFVSGESGQMISDNGIILPSHPNAQRYTIDMVTPTTFNLLIHDAVLADGGTYVCLDANSAAPNVNSGQAEVIVLANHPNCTSLLPADGVTMEFQNYTISCDIYYGGNIIFAPTMTWTGPNPHLSTSIPTESNVFSAVTFTIQRSFDTQHFRLLTNFTAQISVPDGVASNAPEYEHIYNSVEMYVYWGPKNMYAVPIKQTYSEGEIITCYADAFPSAFYQWQNMRTLELTSAQYYTIRPTDVGHNTTLRCQAQNLIQGFLYSANLFVSADVPEPTTTSTVPTTTSPLPEGKCDNLTGWWLSDIPYAEIHLSVPNDQTGQVLGFMRNHTDQQWVEIVGRTQLGTFDYIGITAIWPYEIGVTGLSGECHKCYGTEVIHTGGLWRSSYDGDGACADPGIPSPNVLYQFHRIPYNLYDIHDPSFIVHKPTKHVSGSFGIKHLKY